MPPQRGLLYSPRLHSQILYSQSVDQFMANQNSSSGPKKKKDPAGRGVRFFQASHSNTSKANEFVKQSMVNVSFLSQHSSHCVQQVKRITSCLPHCYGMHAQPALKQMLQKQIYVRCKKQGWRCKHEEKGQHMNTSEPRQVCFSAVTT